MERDSFKPTKQQQACIDSIDKSCAILAGAGSGKTAVIIERIKKIILSGSARLSEIVAITFTEKAAGELIYRLASEIPPEFRSQIGEATITTIDGFCNNILREDAVAAGINPDFEVLEEHASRILNHRIVSEQLKEMLRNGDADAERVVEEMDLKYAVSCLEELVEKRWHTRSAMDPKPKTLREEKLQGSIYNCFEIILKKIEEEKSRLGVIDFADLEIKTLELLEGNKKIRKKYQNRIRHLLIDEFQDTSDLQTEIVTRLYKPGKNTMCIVGDPAQSIYRFRGANPEGIHSIKDLIAGAGGEIFELTENFRSAGPVIEFVNELFCSFMALKPVRNNIPNAKVAVLNLGEEALLAEDLREKEAEMLASTITGLTEKGEWSLSDIAILFRSFGDIRIFERALNRYSIPFYRSGGRTFLKQPEISDIILCLKALADPTDDTIAYGLARSTIIGLSDQDCYKLFVSRPHTPELRYSGTLFEILRRERRSGFLNDLLAVKDYLSTAELIRAIVEKSRLHHTFSVLQSSGQPTANIEKFITLADTISSQYDYSLRDFLEYIDDLKVRGIGIDEPPIFSPRDNAVKLLTVHAAKGLEFRIVILADIDRSDTSYNLPYIIRHPGTPVPAQIGFKLTKDMNPLADREKTETYGEIADDERDKDLLEKERLLYVAMTRAKDLLLLPVASGRNPRSYWGRRLTPAIRKLEIFPVPAGKTTGGLVMGALDFPAPYNGPLPPRETTVPVSQLESFHRCPQEYYLRYVIRLPAEGMKSFTDGMAANTIGSIVHKLISLRNDNIPAACMEYGWPNPLKSDLERIARYLNAYRESDYFDPKLTDPQHEIPFALRLATATIRGTVDCIFRDGAAYTILDYKTDIINSETEMLKKAEEYRIQILTYAIAAGRALKAAVSKMVLLFLDGPSSHEIRLTKSDLDGGYELLTTICNRIMRSDFNPEKGKAPCTTCIYNDLRCQAPVDNFTGAWHRK